MQETDKKQDIGQPPQDAAVPAMHADNAPADIPPAIPFVSAGKKIHNEITYRGVDWLLNSTVGVAFAYWSARTHSGQKYWSQPISHGFKAMLSPIMKNPIHLEEGAKWGSMFVSIMAGGTAIIPPMMVLENKENKKAIIRKLDEMIYGADIVRNDPKFEASYQAIDNEPPKDFNTGMAARFLALAPLIGATLIAATNRPLIKYVYDPIGKGTKALSNKLGLAPKRMLKEGVVELVEGTDKKEFVSNWDFLHRTIGFDFGLTAFYSVLHEIAYKKLAARKCEKNQTEGCVEDKLSPLAPAVALGAEPETQWAAKEEAPARTVKPRSEQRPADFVSRVQASSPETLGHSV